MPTTDYIRSRRAFRLPLRVIGPSIAYVELTRGAFALIDSGDIELVGRNPWALWKPIGVDTGYAVGRGKRMHRVILDTVLEVDHINGNGLDNRRANLRPVTSQQNKWNMRKQKRNTSGFKGVYRNGKGWMAALAVNRKWVHIGTFKTPQEAHAAYCQRAREVYGEFANDGIRTLCEAQSMGQ